MPSRRPGHAGRSAPTRHPPGLYLEAGDLNAGVDLHTDQRDLDRLLPELLARAVATHSGMILGALLGRLAAAELLGAPQAVLAPYRPSRF